MNIPNNVKLKMQSFTNAVRHNDTNDESIKMYRDFIVGNVYGVIKNTFPYFNSYANEELKNKLIECFLQKNQSFDPAFHQIATEILKCSKDVEMSEELRKLIEFEWLVFDTEIADCVVKASKKIAGQVSYEDIAAVEINPSLTIIALPFDVSKLEKAEKLYAEENFLYCIYRDVNHKVIFQRINQLEHVLIDSLVNLGVSTFETEDFQKMQDEYKQYLIQRMRDWHNQNIIEVIA